MADIASGSTTAMVTAAVLLTAADGQQGPQTSNDEELQQNFVAEHEIGGQSLDNHRERRRTYISCSRYAPTGSSTPRFTPRITASAACKLAAMSC
jgi:hypothetical protein